MKEEHGVKYKRFLETFFLLAIILISTSLANETTAFGNDKTIVFTSVPPIAYFIERIGGHEVQVESLIGPKDDPHAFEPKPRQMVALSKARIYFSTNFPFETNILPKIKSSNPDLLVVDISSGATSMEDHDEKCQGSDPHIWTSPLVALKIADDVYRSLALASPEGVEVYRKNYQDLLKDIVALDEEIWNILKAVRGKKFLVFHPAWGHFASDYGLIQVPIEVEGKEPKGAQLVRLIEKARKEGIKVIFVSPQHSKKGAQAVAKAIGAQIIEIDPLSKDWADNLKAVARIFSRVL